MPITLDEIFIELLRPDTLLVEPTVEMPDEPELDTAANPRKAPGGQTMDLIRLFEAG